METKHPIILIGMMGAGKTTIGRLLSQALRCPFYDSDAVIEKEHRCDVSSFFARYGEAAFRACEEEVIARLAQASPGVLAIGGGAILSHRTRQVIFQKGFVVWLHADVDILVRRFSRFQGRPLLAHTNHQETLQRLLRERTIFYEKAHITVPVYQEPPKQTTRRVLQFLTKITPDATLSHVESTNLETQLM